MSPKLKKQLTEIEELKRKLAEAEATVKTARSKATTKVQGLFDPKLVEELRGLEIKKLTVSITEESVNVSLGGVSGRRSGSGGAVEIPEGGVERTYKNEAYKLVKVGDDFEVSKGDESLGTFSSLTAAALHITGQTKGVNGPRWWKLTE